MRKVNYNPLQSKGLVYVLAKMNGGYGIIRTLYFMLLTKMMTLKKISFLRHEQY